MQMAAGAQRNYGVHRWRQAMKKVDRWDDVNVEVDAGTDADVGVGVGAVGAGAGEVNKDTGHLSDGLALGELWRRRSNRPR